MSHFSEVKALIFDMGNVLIRFSHRQVSAELARLTGLSLETIDQNLFQSGLEDQYERGEISTQQLFAEIQSWTQLPLSQEDLIRAANCSFAVIDEVVNMLPVLAERFPLCLLSNTNEIHWNFIERSYPIFAPFQHQVLSFAVKSMKPDPAIYQAAVDALKIPAEHCLFTDDVLLNIHGAERVGLQTIHFQSPEQFRGALIERGIWQGEA